MAHLFGLCLEYTLHFSHVDHREELGEQQECSEEEPDRENEFTHIVQCRMEHRPARRYVIAVQRGHDDYETLEPHTDIHNNGEDERCCNARPDLLDPEQLRRDHVTGHHRPVRPGIRSRDTVVECVSFVFNLRVPGNEQLCDISNTDNRTGDDDNDVHQLDVPDCNVVFKLEYFARH